jgi:hypothetical protein
MRRSGWAATIICVAAIGLGAGCARPQVGLSCRQHTDCPADAVCGLNGCESCESGCGEGSICLRARCLSIECGGRTCPPGSGCVEGRCLDAACVGVACAAGQVCALGQCVDKNCPGQQCGVNEICIEGACTDVYCVGVLCPEGAACAAGQCLPRHCAGQTCLSQEVCLENVCTERACVGVACAVDHACAGGLCLPVHCGDALCPAGSVCHGGVCTERVCVGVVCPSGQACEGGTCSACGPDIDPQTDPNNCGGCGVVCPSPLNAEVRCVGGVCGRGPCHSGFFDLDGESTFGCEATCSQEYCIDGQGNVRPVTTQPPPETGVVVQTLSSGGSYGAAVQTNPKFTNIGILGEPTPPLSHPTGEQSSSSFRNISGFSVSQQP